MSYPHIYHSATTTHVVTVPLLLTCDSQVEDEDEENRAPHTHVYISLILLLLISLLLIHVNLHSEVDDEDEGKQANQDDKKSGEAVAEDSGKRVTVRAGT